MTEINKKSLRGAFGETLLEIAEEVPDLIVLGGDLTKSTKVDAFAERYPERFFNAGIAEQNMIGVAAGLAASGKISLAASFAVFITSRANEQVRAAVALPNLNVKLVGTHAGLSASQDGSSHQSVEDMALMRALPNMTVLAPASAHETKLATRAMVEHKGPVYMRLPRHEVTDVVELSGKKEFVIGQGDQLLTGDDVTIVACGTMTAEAIAVAKMLAAKNVKADVLNMATIKPLDEKLLIESAQKTGKVVTIEDHTIIGGLGGAVAEALSRNQPTPLKSFGINDEFGESGRTEDLYNARGLTADKLTPEILKFINK
ncbi:MAG: transketolase family protein [Parcubacteria group bacterium]|nr:transketolase family protein [Parcubacteria group bacterium]